MFIGQGSARLDFHDQSLIHEKIGKVIAQNRAVLVEHFERPLLFNPDALFSQPMRQPVLVDFLQQSVAEVSMKLKTRLSNQVAKFHDVSH